MDNYQNSNELYHYGVKGMRLGVRRASKKLANATTKEEKAKAVATLNKHKEKGTAKVRKLEKKHAKLESTVDRYVTKVDTKSAATKNQAAITRNKAYGRFTTRGRAERLLYKADKLDARANEIIARSEQAKTKLAQNEKMTELFKKEISNIDSILASKGRKYING